MWELMDGLGFKGLVRGQGKPYIAVLLRGLMIGIQGVFFSLSPAGGCSMHLDTMWVAM